MKLTKEQVKELNSIASEDLKKAQAMLDGINMVLGTEYGWRAKRVVFFEDTTTVAKRYASAHDALLYAE